MALGGNFSGKTSNQFVKPTIIWTAEQNILENYSDVTVELRYSRTNTGYTTGGYFSGSLYVDKGLDSEQKASVSSKYLEITYKSNTLAIQHTFRVPHDQNGAKKITLSASGSISGTSVTSTTISQEVELDTIPRASFVGATDANIGSASLVVVTKKAQEYTHSVHWQFGQLQGYLNADGSIADAEAKFSETSVAFAIPESFYSQIPSEKSGLCILTCITYSGDTQIGEAQTTQFTVTAAEALCTPEVTGKVTDINETTKSLTGDASVLVMYHSTAQCEIFATAKNGASVAAMSVNGLDATGDLQFTNVETGSFMFAVRDSRGYTATAQMDKPLIPYVRLTANASIKRTDPTSGNAVLTVEGNFFNGSFGVERNALSLNCRIGDGDAIEITPAIEGNRYRVSTIIYGLSYDAAHTVTLTASDKLETVQKALTVKKGIPIFDWGEQDFVFHVPVSLDGKPISGLPAPTESTHAANKEYVDNATPEEATQQKSGLMSKEDKQKVDNLGGGLVRIWYNDDLSTAFTAQTVEQDLSNYALVIALSNMSAETQIGVSPAIIEVGSSAYMYGFVDGEMSRRKIEVASTGITFGAGQNYGSYGGSAATNNKHIIPKVVYGIEKLLSAAAIAAICGTFLCGELNVGE